MSSWTLCRSGAIASAQVTVSALHAPPAGLPTLQTWPELDFFIAYNVEETVGKRLRQQLKERAKVRPWADCTSISQLRKPDWWAREYERPFAGWPAARAKIALRPTIWPNNI